MQFYFQLQYRRLIRLLQISGLNPAVAIGVGAVLFALISKGIFLKIPLAAPWVYPFLAGAAFAMAGNRQRNHTIRKAFPSNTFYQLRWVENLILAAPFVAYTLVEWEPGATLIVIGLATLLSRFSLANPFQFPIPTPFSRWPFEFPIGFRKTLWALPTAIFLMAMAFYADNFNLGIFALALVFLICAGFYQRPEPLTYIWNYNLNPAAFLNAKLKTGLVLSAVVTLPFLVALIVLHPPYWWGILIGEAIALLLVAVNLLGKYAYYPSEFNILQALIFGASLFFPPVMLVSLPALYQKAKSNLQPPLTW